MSTSYTPAESTYPLNRNPPPGVVLGTDPLISVNASWTTVDPDPVNPVTYNFTVTRFGNLNQTSTVDWSIVPNAVNPIPASAFGGTYPAGTITFNPGQGSIIAAITLVASPNPARDLYASINLANPINGQLARSGSIWDFTEIGGIIIADAVLALSVPDVTWERSTTVSLSYTMAVNRTGNTSIPCSASLAVTGTGSNPMLGTDFAGGLLNTVASFGSGETTKSFSVVVLPDNSVVKRRPYADDASWNMPVSNFSIHPQSTALASRLWNNGSTTVGLFHLTTAQYSWTIYEVDGSGGNPAANTTIAISYTHHGHADWSTFSEGAMVPWNAAWRPSGGFWAGDDGEDNAMLIVNPATGASMVLWQVALLSGKLQVGSANAGNEDYRIQRDPEASGGDQASCGSGIMPLAGLVRASEVSDGTIKHALRMPTRAESHPNVTIPFVYPATKCDGDPGLGSVSNPGVPAGTRFALNITDANIETWIASLPSALGSTALNSYRVIARALRDYGWFISDAAGAVGHFQLADVLSEDWNSLGLGTSDISGATYPLEALTGLISQSRIVAYSVPKPPAALAPTVLLDKTGVVALSAPSNCKLDSVATSDAVAIPGSSSLLPVVSVTVADVTWDRDLTNPQSYTINVSRSGDLTGSSSVTLAVTGTGLNPMIGSDFVGAALLSTTVNFAASEAGPKTSTVQVAAGALPTNDKTGLVALSAPTGCTVSTTAGSVAVSIPKSVVTPDAILALSVSDTSWETDATAQHSYSITVNRSNNTAIACSATLTVVGTGSNPMDASDFSGGLLTTTVSFAGGETTKSFSVTTLAKAAPSSDRTGQVSLSAPTSCKLDPTATTIGVSIPHSVIIIVSALPPQYTDPNFSGMSAYSIKPTNWTQLQAACVALSGKAACKTTYIELDPTFNDTGDRTLAYNGYVDTVSGKIYPLIICSRRSDIGDRSKKNNLAHFYHILLNGAQWLWLYGIAMEYSVGANGAQSNAGQSGQDRGAIDLSGSSNCFVTRCWLDAPVGIRIAGACTAPYIGANDFYGTVDPGPSGLWQTQIYIHLDSDYPNENQRMKGGLLYQNFFGNLRPGFGNPDASGAFYIGDGIAPPIGHEGSYPDAPYDLNVRESWFYNNLVMTTKKFLVYNKHACNVWRNRVISLKNWNDTTGTGNAFHHIACRGGNWLNGTVKYNTVEANGGHSDVQGWGMTAEFNDWGNQTVNLYMHCGRSGRQPNGKLWKTLAPANDGVYRKNKNGKYNLGATRADVGYIYHAPFKNVQWEGETGCTWNWDSTADGVTCNPSGGTVAWSASTNNNTETFKVTFPSDTAKPGCNAGALTKLSTSSATAVLTTAYADADYTGEFTKAKKGIGANDANCLVWDYVGDGGGGGGGGGGNYDLVSSNMTIWWPSDNMATDYPHTSFTWLAGGGFECKAQNSPSDSPHACMNVWMKTAPPSGDVEFNFYATMLDANTTADSGADGIFALFRPRQKGITAYGDDPNGWAKASWRTHPTYSSPGSDLIIRDRTSGYRHSFANHAPAVANSMQFRCRVSDGGDDGADNSIEVAPTSPNPIPTTGDSFLFVRNTKYLINYKRVANAVTCTKTNTSNNTTQTWTFTNNALGAAGQGVGGWCGFGIFIGRWVRIEPVPNVPFCQ